jgi:putative addiction module component (TIGR02574 family)
MPQRATPMNDLAKALGAQARELSASDRIALIEDVLDSLDNTDPRIDNLWIAEAKDRLAAYRRGELAAKDLNEIIAKYRS